MPLIPGQSQKAFSKNVETEMNSGKPQSQALAIAYNIKRKNRKAHGGMIGKEVESMNHLPEEENDHDGIIEQAAEPMEHVMPEKENEPAYMLARGGLMNPKTMATMVMKKAKNYGQGGMVNAGDEELHGDEKKYVSIDRMPSNPWNEIEGDGELREDMKRRARLGSIMQNLR